ncbi:RsmE family RNA methyltransferase [Alicyclobacillus ferrooxydans]|uniref:Ribosomal RNA small subunit methyltransferase E n=1 Tax=Alicyclobacillus ferrooxydans TaxID=471514 RepID=A0A0N8PMK3_9BACL|nr:16S rRNA (uracil(1498)-N(3))-methyltransferase [Alicyclobacillus ferrooxydans]KPV38965.1 hypothetical protein AN477_23345 [Alicyclobacillus ferrooxydans]
MNPRVFLDREQLHVGQLVMVTGQDGHHLSRVLRVQEGETIAIGASEKGYLAIVQSIDGKAGTVECRIEQELPSHESVVRVYLIQGLPKADKAESIVQHGTEVGLAGYLLYESGRSVVHLDRKKAGQRLERWSKVVREAAGQSQRDLVPDVSYAARWVELKSWVEQLAPGLVLLLDEDEEVRSLKETLTAYAASKQGPISARGAVARQDGLLGTTGLEGTTEMPRGAGDAGVANAGPADGLRPVVLCVGPEGGWDDKERQAFREQIGGVPVTLGPRILRTETAGLVAASAVLYHFHAMGG